MAMSREERMAKYPSIRFNCAWCGRKVITNSSEKLDKRTKYCSSACERQWWRQKTRHPGEPSSDIQRIDL